MRDGSGVNHRKIQTFAQFDHCAYHGLQFHRASSFEILQH